MATIFIDGQAGTTGLEITSRLSDRDDVTLLQIDEQLRKDIGARRELMEAADVVILCLPDDAAREAATLCPATTPLIDASTAHRTHPDWAYGLPELSSQQRQHIQASKRVSNPGCYPQGFILLVRPLIEAGWLAEDLPLTCNALSGYSGGGHAMVEQYEGLTPRETSHYGARPYALQLQHKHVPEMHHYSGSSVRPLFLPTVCNYHKGMVVQVALPRNALTVGPQAVERLYQERYANEPFIQIIAKGAGLMEGGYLDPTVCNDTNRLELMVQGNDDQLLLMARYDNLGKGASGAAVQNMNLLLGIEETTGLLV